MNEIDISKLTNEAEKGHGCIIRDAVANVPFEELPNHETDCREK
jgi:hypothetical protein